MGDREEILDEGALRLEAAILAAQQLSGTDQVWAAVLEVERIRVEVEAATGVSLVEPAPSRVLETALEGAGRVTAEQAMKHLESATPPE
ncbi:hypothetical protein [Streptomyces sp. A012304]|uniref:hypothetical protein n=1 Tax=Streptomyces sp. A012304 TaxID=375446 RepID=UPI0022317162|nr:hypothetical protein [Streptomyces sp. A012304]GKQ37182.1 hypothetical protein ALMP_37210 [Streptomyces sp. A012304]